MLRTLLLVTFLANLGLGVLTLVIGPAELATHFGPGGEPNGWMSATTNAVMMGGISLLLFGMFYGSPHLLKRTPNRWFNLPNREYWLDESRRERTITVLSNELYAIGSATFALMLVVGGFALKANLSEPILLREDWVWYTLGAYGIYTVYWCLNLFLGFRAPDATDFRE